MPQEYQQRRASDQHERSEEPPLRATESLAAFDAVLDEIDAVLQSDAEAFVKSFVQKGGQ